MNGWSAETEKFGLNRLHKLEYSYIANWLINSKVVVFSPQWQLKFTHSRQVIAIYFRFYLSSTQQIVSLIHFECLCDVSGSYLLNRPCAILTNYPMKLGSCFSFANPTMNFFSCLSIGVNFRLLTLSEVHEYLISCYKITVLPIPDLSPWSVFSFTLSYFQFFITRLKMRCLHLLINRPRQFLSTPIRRCQHGSGSTVLDYLGRARGPT